MSHDGAGVREDGARPAPRFVDRLRAGERLLGTMISISDLMLAELVCGAFDFVWIDVEHGALGAQHIPDLCIAARAAGAAALVRLPDPHCTRLPAILDAGVDGIVAPRVQSAADAAELVRCLRYPPVGSRGFGPRRAGHYGRIAAFASSPAAEVACIAQIESARAAAAAAEIAAVEGLDALVVGCSDLSFDLGVPQQLDAPVLRSTIDDVRLSARAAGVAFGIAASGDPAQIAALAAEATLVTYSVDVRLYARAVDEAASGFDSAWRAAVQQDPIGA